MASTVRYFAMQLRGIHVVGLLLLLPSCQISSSPCHRHCLLPVVVIVDVVVVYVVLHCNANAVAVHYHILLHLLPLMHWI